MPSDLAGWLRARAERESAPQRPLQASLSRATPIERQFRPRTIPDARDAVKDPLTGRPLGPGCMVRLPAAKRTLCGKRTKDVPTTWVPWVVEHLGEPRDPLWCVDCAAIYDTLGEPSERA